MGNTVSTSVIRRLPRYYRFLQELMNNGIIRISSRELSEKMGFTASQIRQDFNCFGGFGQQGYGYNVSELHSEIGKILGVDKGYKTILIGAGNLGRAIATHMNFDARGCKLIGIFDVNPELANIEVGNLKIMHTDKIESFCNENSPVIAILCIPKESAQEIADTLVKHGIKAFWNFSHCDLKPTFNDIIVENAHLGDSLMTMVYNVNASSDN